MRQAGSQRSWWPRTASLDVLWPQTGRHPRRQVGASPERPGVAGTFDHKAVALHPERFSDTGRAMAGRSEPGAILVEILAEEHPKIRDTGASPNHREDDAVRRHILFDLHPGNDYGVDRVAGAASTLTLAFHHDSILFDRCDRLSQSRPRRRQPRRDQQPQECEGTETDHHDTPRLCINPPKAHRRVNPYTRPPCLWWISTLAR